MGIGQELGECRGGIHTNAIQRIAFCRAALQGWWIIVCSGIVDYGRFG